MKRFPVIAVLLVFAASCSYFTESKPILKQAEIEKMVAGRVDAEYIGTDNCLSKCHEHDKLASFFKKSVHSEQTDKETLLPLVNCESCHGPGSIAVENIKEVKGKKQCDYDSLIALKKLPSEAKNMTCLKCHSAASSPHLAFWRGSTHDMAGVACSDCHKLHTGPFQKVGHDDQAALCIGCHKKVGADIKNLSHHPIREKKLVCTDCHEPHGSLSKSMMKKETVRETCASCHREKSGPYVFEHADLMEDCTNCHFSHGGMNDKLLKMRQPILCLRCHEAHNSRQAPLTAENKPKYYNRCTDCHMTVHGTDLPSGSRSTFPASGQGRMLR